MGQHSRKTGQSQTTCSASTQKLLYAIRMGFTRHIQQWKWCSDNLTWCIYGWSYQLGTGCHQSRITSFYGSGTQQNSYSLSAPRANRWPRWQTSICQKVASMQWTLERTSKILGWLFNGVTKCMELPEDNLKENDQNWRIGEAHCHIDACIHWHPEWKWIVVTSTCIHCNERKSW